MFLLQFALESDSRRFCGALLLGTKSNCIVDYSLTRRSTLTPRNAKLDKTNKTFEAYILGEVKRYKSADAEENEYEMR